MGSNPTQSIESSVQIPAQSGNKNLNEYTTVYLSPANGIHISDNNLRDLYNRSKRVEQWINKIYTQLEEPDRSDVLKLVEHMKEQEKSALWIIRYLSAILFLRKKLENHFVIAQNKKLKNSWNG